MHLVSMRRSGGFFRLPKPSRFEYKPRYYKPDDEEHDTIRFSKRLSSRYSRSALTDEMAKRKYFSRSRSLKRQRTYRMMLLLALMGVLTAYYLWDLSLVLTLIAVLVLLVLFIREMNKR